MFISFYYCYVLTAIIIVIDMYFFSMVIQSIHSFELQKSLFYGKNFP